MCTSCGAEQWLNAKPCANALVVAEGQVLLVRRAHHPWYGGWCAPGGFCDATEHPAAAAEREIREETGLQARVTRLLGIWLDAYADDPLDPEADWISVAYYLAEPVGDRRLTRLDSREVAEAGWFRLEEPPEPLVPGGTLPAVLAAARALLPEGRVEPWLPDRPGSE